jgi:sensor histidine kinase YesM
LVKILASNTLIAGLFALLAALGGGGGRSLLPTFLISLIYASIIGTAAHLVLPVLADRLAGRSRVLHWLGLAGGLAGLAVAGSLVAGTVASALGLFGGGSRWEAQRTSLGISLVLTLSAGLVIALYESTRNRLAEAGERLRARELDMERARRLTADARLASLESRLHPHFLFNAIAAIAGQVREAPEHAERLLVEFAGLLRASLDTTRRHTVPLEEELTILRAYLEIEQARLGERLAWKLEVPGELLEWPVPPFTLHTLVQNSVKHVAAARPKGAEIRVQAWRAGERLALSVWDDGPGLDLAAAPAGHGLETLRARLTVLYGGEAALEAAREAGGGSVTVVLPARPGLAGPG